MSTSGRRHDSPRSSVSSSGGTEDQEFVPESCGVCGVNPPVYAIRVQPCGHCFCEACLLKKADGKRLQCPAELCSVTIESAETLDDNTETKRFEQTPLPASKRELPRLVAAVTRIATLKDNVAEHVLLMVRYRSIFAELYAVAAAEDDMWRTELARLQLLPTLAELTESYPALAVKVWSLSVVRAFAQHEEWKGRLLEAGFGRVMIREIQSQFELVGFELYPDGHSTVSKAYLHGEAVPATEFRELVAVAVGTLSELLSKDAPDVRAAVSDMLRANDEKVFPLLFDCALLAAEAGDTKTPVLVYTIVWRLLFLSEEAAVGLVRAPLGLLRLVLQSRLMLESPKQFAEMWMAVVRLLSMRSDLHEPLTAAGVPSVLWNHVLRLAGGVNENREAIVDGLVACCFFAHSHAGLWGLWSGAEETLPKELVMRIGKAPVSAVHTKHIDALLALAVNDVEAPRCNPLRSDVTVYAVELLAALTWRTLHAHTQTALPDHEGAATAVVSEAAMKKARHQLLRGILFTPKAAKVLLGLIDASLPLQLLRLREHDDDDERERAIELEDLRNLPEHVQNETLGARDENRDRLRQGRLQEFVQTHMHNAAHLQRPSRAECTLPLRAAWRSLQRSVSVLLLFGRPSESCGRQSVECAMLMWEIVRGKFVLARLQAAVNEQSEKEGLLELPTLEESVWPQPDELDELILDMVSLFTYSAHVCTQPLDPATVACLVELLAHSATRPPTKTLITHALLNALHPKGGAQFVLSYEVLEELAANRRSVSLETFYHRNGNLPTVASPLFLSWDPVPVTHPAFVCHAVYASMSDDVDVIAENCLTVLNSGLLAAASAAFNSVSGPHERIRIHLEPSFPLIDTSPAYWVANRALTIETLMWHTLLLDLMLAVMNVSLLEYRSHEFPPDEVVLKRRMSVTPSMRKSFATSAVLENRSRASSRLSSYSSADGRSSVASTRSRRQPSHRRHGGGSHGGSFVADLSEPILESPFNNARLCALLASAFCRMDSVQSVNIGARLIHDVILTNRLLIVSVVSRLFSEFVSCRAVFLDETSQGPTEFGPQLLRVISQSREPSDLLNCAYLVERLTANPRQLMGLSGPRQMLSLCHAVRYTIIQHIQKQLVLPDVDSCLVLHNIVTSLYRFLLTNRLPLADQTQSTRELFESLASALAEWLCVVIGESMPHPEFGARRLVDEAQAEPWTDTKWNAVLAVTGVLWALSDELEACATAIYYHTNALTLVLQLLLRVFWRKRYDEMSMACRLDVHKLPDRIGSQADPPPELPLAVAGLLSTFRSQKALLERMRADVILSECVMALLQGWFDASTITVRMDAYDPDVDVYTHQRVGQRRARDVRAINLNTMASHLLLFVNAVGLPQCWPVVPMFWERTRPHRRLSRDPAEEEEKKEMHMQLSEAVGGRVQPGVGRRTSIVIVTNDDEDDDEPVMIAAIAPKVKAQWLETMRSLRESVCARQELLETRFNVLERGNLGMLLGKDAYTRLQAHVDAMAAVTADPHVTGVETQRTPRTVYDDRGDARLKVWVEDVFISLARKKKI